MPPVIFAPDALTVKPFAAVIVPDPVVAMLPEVERFPFSLIVSVLEPPC